MQLTRVKQPEHTDTNTIRNTRCACHATASVPHKYNYPDHEV